MSINNSTDHFVTYQKRPKNASAVNFNIYGKRYEDYAIILQGPLIQEENFTIESIKLYAKSFPGVLLIVSSWDDTNNQLKERAEKCGAVFLGNQRPPFAGEQNINLQLTSTLAALNFIKEKGIKYAAKTRTDQRIYSPYFFNAINLHTKFEVEPGYGLNNRLIVSSMSSLKYRPYGISDMFMLGEIDDLISYWSSPLDLRTIKLRSNLTVKDWAKLQMAETYILSNFLIRKNIPLNYSLSQTWKIYKDIFLVLDKSSFDLFWYKYSREKEHRLELYDDYVFSEISFLDYLSDKHILDESILDGRILSRYDP